jgi:hypothetical protein
VVRPSECHPEKSHFGKGLCSTCYSYKWHQENKVRRRARLRERYQEDASFKERVTRGAAQWAAENRPRRRATNRASYLRRRYNLTEDGRSAMLLSQAGACLICQQDESLVGTLHVDHNHETGEVRGLLCGSCNKALGAFRDNPEVLERAARYIRQKGRI